MAVRKRGGYLPPPLPSEVVLRNETWTAAADAQALLSRLDVRVQEFSQAKRWAHQAFLREIHASAQLDDVMVPWREALVIDATGQSITEETRRFVGYLETGARVAEAATAGRALNTDFLAQLSAVMAGTTDIDVDRWQTSPAWPGESDPSKAQHPHAPPVPELVVATEQWCTWKRVQRSMPPVVKCPLQFTQFVRISPFPGSTHIARLAIHHELVSSKVLSAPVLPLSEWLYRKRAQLQRLIREVINHGDFNDLVTFFATGIRATCRREMLLIKQAQDKTAERASSIVAKMTSMVTLIEALSVTPMMTLPQVAEVCDVSDSQASNLARQLQDDDVVRSLDPDSYQGLLDDIAYRKIIYIPEVIRSPLDTFPQDAP